jgi:hypothetical protein
LIEDRQPLPVIFTECQAREDRRVAPNSPARRPGILVQLRAHNARLPDDLLDAVGRRGDTPRLDALAHLQQRDSVFMYRPTANPGKHVGCEVMNRPASQLT